MNCALSHLAPPQHSGDQVCVAPYARLDDGLLDLMIIPSMGKVCMVGIARECACVFLLGMGEGRVRCLCV